MGSRELGEESPKERAKQGGPALAGIMNELKEAEVSGEILLGNAAMRSKPGTQERPEAFHGVDMDCMEAVAVFISGILARPMADALVLIAPLIEACIDVVFIGVDHGTELYGGLNQGFDGGLLDVLEHLDEHLAAALEHPEDRRLLRLQRSTARSTFQTPAAAHTPFFSTAAGLPLCPATM